MDNVDKRLMRVANRMNEAFEAIRDEEDLSEMETLLAVSTFSYGVTLGISVKQIAEENKT